MPGPEAQNEPQPDASIVTIEQARVLRNRKKREQAAKAAAEPSPDTTPNPGRRQPFSREPRPVRSMMGTIADQPPANADEMLERIEQRAKDAAEANAPTKADIFAHIDSEEILAFINSDQATQRPADDTTQAPRGSADLQSDHARTRQRPTAGARTAPRDQRTRTSLLLWLGGGTGALILIVAVTLALSASQHSKAHHAAVHVTTDSKLSSPPPAQIDLTTSTPPLINAGMRTAETDLHRSVIAAAQAEKRAARRRAVAAKAAAKAKKAKLAAAQRAATEPPAGAAPTPSYSTPSPSSAKTTAGTASASGTAESSSSQSSLSALGGVVGNSCNPTCR